MGKSKKIQAQLKELRYGKKDLIFKGIICMNSPFDLQDSLKKKKEEGPNSVDFKGQQLMDLEHKLTIAKEELEKTALDKPGSSHRFPVSPAHLFRYSSLINSSRVTFQQPHAKDISKVQRIAADSKSPEKLGVMRREGDGVTGCQMEKPGGSCFQNQTEESAPDSKTLPEPQQQRSQPQTGKSDTKLSDDSEAAEGGSSKKTKPHEHD
ncbi:Leucine zipper protein 2 [Liparis tanakae]|uniref:Leucine zipper protein 2 n=1 Tax=Liparis tanakae TaxID=230148 RepID=A0A4Z2H064_9TELE|nr:Leucine zipper protein 2 [Liparis tanakae]